MISPKKNLGQNFLIDKNIIRKIVECIALRKDDTLIEIGPGTGALTEFFLQTGAKVISVEIDKRAVELLNQKFSLSLYPNFEIVNGDFLKFELPENLAGKKIKIVGNIPYYISGDILFKLFYLSENLDSSVIMMQKEVAERLVAHSCTKEYGILSVVAQSVANIQKCFDVSPNCFFPKPKVTSSVVKFNYEKKLPEDVNFKDFMTFVKAAFSQRRKTLRNSLKTYLATRNIAENDSFSADLSLRAEALDLSEFIHLYQTLCKYDRR